jgi:replication-associated recombination protein RarA
VRLYEKLRPNTLSDIVGQPDVTGPLSAFLLEPYPTIIALTGPTGCGKTATAMALSNALADQGWFGGSAYCETGAGFKTEVAEHYFGSETPFRYKTGDNKFHVLRIEELERLPPNVQNDLKESLEWAQRTYRVIIIATSNDTSRLEKALLHRFQRYTFDAGPKFAKAFNEWIEMLWLIETGDLDMPADHHLWGYELDRIAAGDGEFSARLALDRMERVLSERKLVTA